MEMSLMDARITCNLASSTGGTRAGDPKRDDRG